MHENSKTRVTVSCCCSLTGLLNKDPYPCNNLTHPCTSQTLIGAKVKVSSTYQCNTSVWVFFNTQSLVRKSALDMQKDRKLFKEHLDIYRSRLRTANSSQTETNLLSWRNPLNFQCKQDGPSHTSPHVLARSPHLETVARNIIQRGRRCPPLV